MSATNTDLNNLNVTGTITIPTATPLTNSTVAASTAYTDAAVTAGTTVHTATVTLTSTQILGLNSTFVDLVSAPGAGKMIVPQTITLNYIFNTTAYTMVSSPQFFFVWGHQSGNSYNYFPAATGLLDQTSNRMMWSGGVTEAAFTTNTTYINSLFSVFFGAGSATLGNGTLKITVTYYILSVS